MQIPQELSTVSFTSTSGDNRPTTLRMAHTFVDALLATAIVVVWQRLYGEQETGMMAAPLRVMGFMPALVHMAWAQVILAQPQYARTNPLWAGLAGFTSVALLGGVCLFALNLGWLSAEWEGVRPYLLPLVLWQGSACVAAAFSHLPFQRLNARHYSLICMGVACLQGSVLLIPALHVFAPTGQVHFLIFGVVSACALLAMTFYLNNIAREDIHSRT
jgi:hypothetical protein